MKNQTLSLHCHSCHCHESGLPRFPLPPTHWQANAWMRPGFWIPRSKAKRRGFVEFVCRSVCRSLWDLQVRQGGKWQCIFGCVHIYIYIFVGGIFIFHSWYSEDLTDIDRLRRRFAREIHDSRFIGCSVGRCFAQRFRLASAQNCSQGPAEGWWRGSNGCRYSPEVANATFWRGSATKLVPCVTH